MPLLEMVVLVSLTAKIFISHSFVNVGRLAACFMDSLATLDYPAWGIIFK